MPTGERANYRRRTQVCFDLVPLPGDTATHLMGAPGDGRPRASLAERLWPKIAGDWLDGISADDCWLWLGAQGRTGRGWKGKWHYGRIRGDDGIMIGAHRAALIVTSLPIPRDDALACHRCNNHLCCNPRHLYWGSMADNMADQVHNGTRSFVPGSVYSRTQVADWIAAEEAERYWAAEQVAVC